MAETTSIAWCTSSWSPWIGCTEVSPGCDHCYARVLDARHRYGGATHWGAGVPRYRTKSWNQPALWNKKAAESGDRWTVFPSLCDPFDNEVPVEWRTDLWWLIAETPHLTWLLLTKRIGNARLMLPWTQMYPPNVWIGASVVNQMEADRDIPKLLATPAAKRFVSYEPALGPIDWRWVLYEPTANTRTYAGRRQMELRKKSPCVDWIIVGGESNQGKHRARPFDLAWARSTVTQSRSAGVPVFVKQLGSTIRVRNDSGNEWPSENAFDDAIPNTYDPAYQGEEVCIRLKDRAGADPAEWPEDLRVQEFIA